MRPWVLLAISTAVKTVNVKYISLVLVIHNKLVKRM